MVPSILLRFAQLLGAEINNHQLEIPEKFGTGYCAGFVFNAHIRLLISNYELREELVIPNPELHTGRRMLFFKFQNLTSLPSVLIATSRLNTDKLIAIHTNRATINIEVDADYLKGLFDAPERSPVLQSLLENTQPFLFEQLLEPSLQNIAAEIVSEQAGGTFALFFLRVKAEELVCRLLMVLERRAEQKLYPLNSQDIQTIYHVRDQMLANLGRPPLIAAVAVNAGMSPTKLKRLFSQIFGNSIFSYYQEFRIKEAASLLKDGQLTVSAVGYQLGFTNLSHFSRVFQEHTGMKPKQYSRSG